MIASTPPAPLNPPIAITARVNGLSSDSVLRLSEGKQITIHLTNIDPIVCRPARSRRY